MAEIAITLADNTRILWSIKAPLKKKKKKRETALLKGLENRNKPLIQGEILSLEKDPMLSLGLIWAGGCTSVPSSHITKFSKLMRRPWEKSPGLMPSGQKLEDFCCREPVSCKKKLWEVAEAPSRLSQISFAPASSPQCPTQLSHSLPPIVPQTSLPS